MRHDIYTLPQITMVGGQSETIRWRLFDKNGVPYDASGLDNMHFALMDYSNQSGTEPTLTEDVFVEQDSESGVSNVLVVVLKPSNTVDLFGKYIYQLTLVNGIDEVQIPDQGIIFIAHNIDSSFLKS